MLRTNENRVAEILIQCQPGPPRVGRGWRVDHDGKPFLLPGIGGITINIEAGDPAFGWAGDHLEPGVSCTANTKKPFEHPNPGLQFYACTGNQATMVTGKAKGAKGTVLGHHGGSEHVIIDFARSAKRKLTYDDKIIIRSKGQGLALVDYPKIALLNLDPGLLKKMKIKEIDKKKISVPVTTIVPAECMGSGLGASDAKRGDYDIMTSDKKTVEKYKIDKIRFGDFVAILDHDNSYGRSFKKGSITIGIVVHSNCLVAGHGPGVTGLITCPERLIEPVLDRKANIVEYLKIGTKRVTK